MEDSHMGELTPPNTSAAKLFQENPYTDIEDDQSKPESSKLNFLYCSCGYRWLTIVFIALGMVVIHAQRVNVSVSLLAVYDNLDDKVGSDQARANLPYTAWSALQISLLHSGFYTGYLLTQIPAGLLSYKYKANRIFGVSIAVSCALNLVLPTVISLDVYWATMIIRVCQGLAEGFIWPASFILVHNWSTKHESNKQAGFVATGSYAGAIIGFPLSGVITHYIGWQYVYYSSGAAGIVWWIFWLILVYEKPDHHPKINDKELLLLTSSKMNSYQFSSWNEVPWKRIASSPPFIALCACAFAKGWVFNLLLMQEPTYMHVFGFNIAANGTLSALPFLMKVIVCYISGIIADILVNKTIANRTYVRKLFNTLGFGIEAICLFCLSFVFDSTIALILLSFGVSMGGMAVSGWQINHLDLAPKLAGILVAVSQCFSNLAGIFSPLAAGAFIEESADLAIAMNRSFKSSNVDIYGWHMVFLLSSLIILVCTVIYLLLGSGEEQEWAKILPTNHDSSMPLTDKIMTSVSYHTIDNSDQQTAPREHDDSYDDEQRSYRTAQSDEGHNDEKE